MDDESIQLYFDFGSPTLIPEGYCQCGCGRRTNISDRNDTKYGAVKGRPSRFLRGHQNQLRKTPPYVGPVKLCECGCGEPAPISKRTSKQEGVAIKQPLRFIKGHQNRFQRAPGGRLCSKCNQVQPEGAFKPRGHVCIDCFRAKSRRDGAKSYHKNPQKHRDSALRAQNRKHDEYLERQRIWREANGRRYRAEHRDQIYACFARRRAAIAKSALIEKVDRAAIIARDNSTCYLWCGRKLEPSEITIEHVVPLSRGGTHTADNLRVACMPCNSRKGRRLLSELSGLPGITAVSDIEV